MVPGPRSLTMPRCLAYQARRASGFSDLKKIPPMPRTRFMGVCYATNSIESTREKASRRRSIKHRRLRTRRLLRFELGWELHFCPILGRKGGSCLLVGARKLLRVVDEVKEKDAHIKSRASKFPK